MVYGIEMTPSGMKYKQSFMKIGTGVQAILRFCFSNLIFVMLVLPKEMN
jgi:hypothetical protein